MLAFILVSLAQGRNSHSSGKPIGSVYSVRSGIAEVLVNNGLNKLPTSRALVPNLAQNTVSPARWMNNSSHLQIQMHWNRNKTRISTSVESHGKELTSFRISPSSAGNPSWTYQETIESGDEIFGLGQDNKNGGRLNRRGTVRDLWAGQQIHTGDVTAEYSIPFYIVTHRSGKSFGVFLDNPYHLNFDLANTKRNTIVCRADGGPIRFFVFNGPTVADVIEQYTDVTGKPSLPPLWSLGYWQSKCVFYTWPQIDNTYHQISKDGFPLDVFVIDYSWPQYLNNFVWDKRWTGNGFTPASKLADYAKKHVHFVLSASGPMIVKNSPTFAPGWKDHVFATDGHGHAITAGYYRGKLLDFTAPNMSKWLWPQLAPREKEGVSGWWLDLSEPEGEPSDAHYYGGTSANIHNQFSLLNTTSFEGAQLAVHPNQRPFILTRCGSSGIQRHHAALWSGDIHSNFSTLNAHPPEMLNSGISGLTYWTCDTGGFLEGFDKNDRFGAHARLYERWMQFSSFSPITRAHKAGSCFPYEFGYPTLSNTRHYLRLRYKLMPYIYSMAWQSHVTGLPIDRALPIEFPHDPGSLTTPGNEYMFGSELLVAPITTDGLTQRSVYFPPGKWIDWDYGNVYGGKKKAFIPAPLDRIPVFIKAGAILPMAHFAPTTAQENWNRIKVEVFPYGYSAFNLYRDDGKSFDFKRGGYTITRFVSNQRGRSIQFSITESNKKFATKLYALRFHVAEHPKFVAVDGIRTTSFRYSSGVLRLNVKSKLNRKHVIEIKFAQRLRLNQSKVAIHSSKNDDGYPIPRKSGTTVPGIFSLNDFDFGGPGLAFHLPWIRTFEANPSTPSSKLVQGEWLSYSVNTPRGGYFDFSCDAKPSSQKWKIDVMLAERVVATVNQSQLSEKNIYLPQGRSRLVLVVRSGEVKFHSFTISNAVAPRSLVPASDGNYTGSADIGGPDSAASGQYLTGLGRIGGTATWTILSPFNGKGELQMTYRNSNLVPVSLRFKMSGRPSKVVQFNPTLNGAWENMLIPTQFVSKWSTFSLIGFHNDYNNIDIKSVQALNN